MKVQTIFMPATSDLLAHGALVRRRTSNDEGLVLHVEKDGSATVAWKGDGRVNLAPAAKGTLLLDLGRQETRNRMADRIMSTLIPKWPAPCTSHEWIRPNKHHAPRVWTLGGYIPFAAAPLTEWECQAIRNPGPAFIVDGLGTLQLAEEVRLPDGSSVLNALALRLTYLQIIVAKRLVTSAG